MIPPSVVKLNELSYNLHWSWQNSFYTLFEEIDRDKWEWTNHNPVKFLNEMNTDLLTYIIKNKDLEGKIDALYREYHNYLKEPTYFASKYFTPNQPLIAYFSAEYGITECLKFYSGGLGVLSGDHMKSSSDLGIPLVGIGLAYSNGYFAQYVDDAGRQLEFYEQNDFNNLPIYPLRDNFNTPVLIELGFPGRQLFVKVWVINIGRSKLYLLDTNLELNESEDKHITDILYGGDKDKRIEQEIVLGIGGVRLLKRLGYDIKAFHLNEGHSAFLCLERIKECMRKREVSFQEAKSICYESNIFTTHTPVPAGIDIFSKDLVTKYFKEYAENELVISVDEMLGEGVLDRNGHTESDEFNMAHLAINNSAHINGVSKLHKEVSRKMWNLPSSREPIDSITNGIHTLSYLSTSCNELYKLRFGNNWYEDEEVWQRIEEIPDEEIWNTRMVNRLELVRYVRNKLKTDTTVKGFDIPNTDKVLDDNVLTIGFARRFATYKRGNLIFKDIERLKKIVGNTEMPVQFLFSGKAHPKDNEGKYLIEQIVLNSEDDVLRNKVIFLENYNLDIAKHLVKGCDIWLNNPRRPLEASGTSGMKIIANGGLNFSILDGWWDEGYSEKTGWEIDSAPNYESISQEERDFFEVESLYNTLEKQIVPLFYKRNQSGIPVEWVKKIKSSIKELAGYFNTNRMVKEYTEKLYMSVIFKDANSSKV